MAISDEDSSAEDHPALPLVRRVLELTLPDSPLPIERDSSLSWIVAMLARARRQLQAMVLLDGSGMRDCEEGLVRSIFEHFATGLWLLETPNDNFETFLRAHRRDLRLLAEARPARYNEWLDGVTAIVEAEFGHGSQEVRLPPFEQRGPDIVKMRYWVYREMSARAHAGVLSSSGYVVETNTGWLMREKGRPEGDFELGYLPYAAFLVAGLGAALFKPIDAARSMDLVAVMSEFVGYHVDRKPGGWLLG